MAVAIPLFESEDVCVAELVQPRDDDVWGEENLVTRPILGFPITPTRVVRRDHADVVDANHVALHQRGEDYYRERLGGARYRSWLSRALASWARADSDPLLAAETAYRILHRSVRASYAAAGGGDPEPPQAVPPTWPAMAAISARAYRRTGRTVEGVAALRLAGTCSTRPLVRPR